MWNSRVKKLNFNKNLYIARQFAAFSQQDDSCPHRPTEMEVATAQVPVIAAPPAPTCNTCPEIATTVKKKHSGTGCSAHYSLGRPLGSKKMTKHVPSWLTKSSKCKDPSTACMAFTADICYNNSKSFISM
jgi:hypothetical protein